MGCTGGAQFPVELPRPLGIVFAEKKNGDIRVDELVEGGNAATSGKVLQGDRLVKCGLMDALVDCEGLGFDGVLDVLGGSPDSDVMTVVVERMVEEVCTDRLPSAAILRIAQAVRGR